MKKKNKNKLYIFIILMLIIVLVFAFIYKGAKKYQLNEEIKLYPMQTARINDELNITLISIKFNECPKDAMCFIEDHYSYKLRINGKQQYLDLYRNQYIYNHDYKIELIDKDSKRYVKIKVTKVEKNESDKKKNV